MLGSCGNKAVVELHAVFFVQGLRKVTSKKQEKMYEGMCKRGKIFYECTMRLMLAYVKNMWKRSNISHQRNTHHDEGASATERC